MGEHSRPGPARRLWSRLLRRPRPTVEVTLFRTRACPLCEEALAVLRRARRRLGIRVRTRDISDQPELIARYGDRVPVVLIAGRERFHGHVDPVLLRRTVEGERARAAGSAGG